jgi:hypothetical protein
VEGPVETVRETPGPPEAAPIVELPRPTSRADVLRTLHPRVRDLYERLTANGSLGTQDHMVSAGVSHRTGLRDLQLLVELGLAERVGTRRGARYRPRN